MRIVQGRPASRNNNLQVFSVRWKSKKRPGRVLSSVLYRTREQAEAIYAIKERAGMEPELVVSHIMGFAL